ncbi:MAG: efflux RND transporter periplasmic adaptor subunit [Myxococcales bacterium]|nr:efflux RND transporter periplasmic adaptor subunit [Myxococcales bacterium]
MKLHLYGLALLIAAGCTEKAQPEAAPTADQSKPRVITVDPGLVAAGRIGVTRAELRPVSGYVVATGQVEAPPDSAAAVTSPITARVREIVVRRGDAVKKGDRLAVLDAGEIARVRADHARAKSRRIHAERVLAQEEKLDAEKATSARAVSDAKSAVDVARADERAAASLLSSFGAAGGAQLVLKAPIDGVVVAVDGVVGAPVEVTTPLFRLVDTTRLQIRADVPENDADHVPEGASATLSIGGKPIACAAKVESHAPNVDATTRTVPFRIRLGEKCGDFHAGAFVDVAIERAADGGRKLVSLSRDSVVSVDEVPMVFVAGAPGEFEPRSVRVAEWAGPRVFLENGVRDGESVVDRGALLLKGELMRSRLE